MDLNKQIELLKQVLEKLTNFDSEQEKIDYILDLTIEYKKLLLPNVVGQSEQLVCEHPFNRRVKSDPFTVICGKCKKVI